jgi:hypothetical protein
MTKPMLKNRSGQSSCRALARHYEPPSCGEARGRSVSGPGMSIAQVCANSGVIDVEDLVIEAL